MGVSSKKDNKSFSSELNDKQLARLCSLLSKKFGYEKSLKKYIQVKQILTLIGKAAVVGGIILAPKTAKSFYPLLKNKRDKEAWRRFNPSYLKRTLKRLAKGKVVQIEEKGNYQIVKLKKKGKQRVLKFALSELELRKPKVWDRKWRLVIYDISIKKNRLRTLIRETLKRLKFLKIQESVYLTPYPCEEEIEFLREYYGLGEDIKILTVSELEDDKVYREYFGI